jgi:hypothetical protein
VVESAWEDASTGSALMVCNDHAERYARVDGPAPADAVLRAHRRHADR